MKKLIIMDFDGLMVDSEVAAFEVCREILKRDYDFELSLSDHLICVGSKTAVLCAHLRKKYGLPVDPTSFSKNVQCEARRRAWNLPLLPGVGDFIEKARKMAHLALCTSSKRAKMEAFLPHLGLADVFDWVVTQEDVERIKPHPDPYCKVLQWAEVEPSEALILEDSHNGLQAGNAASIDVYIVPNAITRYSDFRGAKAVLSCIADFPWHAVSFAEKTPGKEAFSNKRGKLFQ